MAKLGDTGGLFKPNPSRQESKASTTDNAARLIAQAELNSREAKTARLRAQRLKMEAEAPPPEPVAKKRPARAKAAK